MTIMQRDFLDHLAKLLKTYNVDSIYAVMDKIIIEFEDENMMQFTGYNGASEIFREVATQTDYKPNETELDTE